MNPLGTVPRYLGAESMAFGVGERKISVTYSFGEVLVSERRRGASYQGDSPFSFSEGDNGSLLLHAMLNGKNMDIEVPSLRRRMGAPLASGTTSPQKVPKGNSFPASTFILVATALVAALMSGGLHQSSPLDLPLASTEWASDRKLEDLSLGADVSLPRDRSLQSSPGAGRNLARAVDRASPHFHLNQPSGAGPADYPAVRKRRAYVAPVVADEVTLDPYAGRVAHPLSGPDLQSAIAADALATREINLHQLQAIRAENGDATAQRAFSNIR